MRKLVYGEVFVRTEVSPPRLEIRLLSWCCSAALVKHIDRKYARDLPRLGRSVPVKWLSCESCDHKITEDSSVQQPGFVCWPATAEELTFMSEEHLTIAASWYGAFCSLDPLTALLQARALLEACDGLLTSRESAYGSFDLTPTPVKLDA